jgi:mannose-6-phosphate isomerase-like protein (cupin superfamily)
MRGWFLAGLLTACAPSASAPAAAPSPPPASVPDAAPVSTRFVDLGDTPERLAVEPCQGLYVSIVQGSATAGEQALGVGDLLVVHPTGNPVAPIELHGHGVAVVVRGPRLNCTGGPSAPTHADVVPATAAPELTFLGGAMHAHLDLVDPSATIYVGRLGGTAGVPEHTHPSSWEILCDLEASGTFTLDGKAQHLGPRACVAVPPGVKHSWQPDPGSTLVAVQIYSPPGPEQRFKKMAAEGR